MQTAGVIFALGVLVLLGLSVIGLKDWWKWTGIRRRYRSVQAGRTALSNEMFCIRAGLEPSTSEVVSLIRVKLAEQGPYDPDRIYPEDDFWPQFGLQYDDEVAMVVQDMNIVPGYREYSFPLEQVDSVTEFIKVILRLQRDAAALRTTATLS